MAIKPSGTPLSLSEIQTEFGGTNPISLSEYYRGGGLVPNGPTQNNGIATSGAINMGAFYGAVKAFQFNQTISSNTTNYNLRNAAVAAGWDGATPLQATVTINSGIYVSANSTGVYAFDTGASFPAGSSLSLVNNGIIVGVGGAGGRGAGWSNVSSKIPDGGYAGGGGGPALRAQAAISITNNGTIAGGGGGGGGGGNYIFDSGKGVLSAPVGGGGGGGRSSAAANAGGGPFGNLAGSSQAGASNGGTGTVSGQAGGGSGGYYNQAPLGYGQQYGGAGGAGGGWGASGATGANGYSNPDWTGLYGSGQKAGPTAGGGGGTAVAGNGNITWVATGTRLGAIA